MNTQAADKDILTLEETIVHFGLSRRRFYELVHEQNPFTVKYYNDRRLILKAQFETYLAVHPELRKRGTR